MSKDPHPDFWLSSGHHLLDRGVDGRLVLTDEFLKAYLARPELMPPPQACAMERQVHAALIEDPRRPVAPSQIAAIADLDAQENWRFAIVWRDLLLREPTLESAYLAIVRERASLPPLFLGQLIQVVLRNILDGCTDCFVLRAAEMFFRPQQLSVLEGALLACDSEFASGPVQWAEVMSDENSTTYWNRSDAFDMALDLTAGRRGLSALGDVAARWIRHLLGVTVTIEAVTELRDARLTWYVGLDSQATRIGDALWQGEDVGASTRELLVGLFQLTFAEQQAILESARGSPTYLISAMTPDMTLRMKPQNLITGLPLNPTWSRAN
jgi:hypothetical protein